MTIDAEAAWVLEKLVSDPPDEVLKFVIWVLWETKPESIPSDEAAMYWRQVLTNRPAAACEPIQKALGELDEFVSPRK